MKYKTVIEQVKRQIPVGYYLVRFDLIWDIDDETGHESIGEIEGEVIKVTEDHLFTDGMSLETNTKDSHGDTHDFRDRLFKTKREAKAHLDFTLKRWKNPMPWESFIKF